MSWPAARRVVAHKMSSVAGLPRTTQYRRLAGALARKGYSGSTAATVVREALNEAEAQGESDDLI